MTPSASSESARSFELASLFDSVSDRIEVLSLDCFDTLLWRRTSRPVDVFYDLQHAPTFARLGLNPMLRMRAEGSARSARQLRDGKTEVRLTDIYRQAFPELSEAELEALSEEELAAEMAACVGFLPVMNLVRRAHAAGVKVVIASDTYLSANQLSRLLQARLPADVWGAIAKVYCSSELGRSKGQGMLGLVKDDLRVKPERILHIGDNPISDYEAAGKAGMLRAHLRQLDEIAEEIVRMSGSAANLLAPEVGARRSLPSPFHPVFAQRQELTTPQQVLGELGVGPLLYAFGRFIVDEVRALEEAGKRPKVLFLMRDAHLPKRACEAICGEPFGHAVAISRFASYAASFRCRGDIESYLVKSAGSGKFEAMAKQLLLPEALAAKIVNKATAHRKGTEEFCRLALQDKTVAVVVEESRKYRERLFAYLRKTAGVEAGDTLVLVDLGYEGTAQRQLQPVFEDALGVSVVGRYLLVVRTPGWERARKGLLDPSWCDDRALLGLVPYIALLEDLCTCDEGSALDYTEDGQVVLAERVLEDEQYARIAPVQDACVAFCEFAESYFTEADTRPDADSLRITALGALGRLLFMPTHFEVDYLEGFRLDMNMATLDSFALFDRQAGLVGLRRRGLFFMERNHERLRMNYPIEVRSAGLELAVTLLAQHRYGLSFSQSELSLRRESIDVVAIRGEESVSATFDAVPTHDGYFSVVVPVGERDLNVGLLLGKRYTWLELDAVELIPVGSLLTDSESLRTSDALPHVTFEGMDARSARLYQCNDASAFLFIQPGAGPVQRPGQYVCRVTFRPLEWRAAELSDAVDGEARAHRASSPPGAE